MGAVLFFLQKKRLKKWSEIQKEKCGLKKFFWTAIFNIRLKKDIFKKAIFR